MKRGLAFVVLFAVPAWADASWLTARGRLLDRVHAEVWGGSRSAGVGVVVPDGPGATAALAAELVWNLFDRTAELRGARQWQFTATRFATVSATVGVTGLVVPEGNFDLGVGPHGGVTLSLGGEAFSVDVGLQTGLELFVREPLRLPQRVLLGFTVHVAMVTVSVMGRAGLDVQPGRNFAGRAEFIVSLGWVGPSNRAQ